MVFCARAMNTFLRTKGTNFGDDVRRYTLNVQSVVNVKIPIKWHDGVDGE